MTDSIYNDSYFQRLTRQNYDGSILAKAINTIYNPASAIDFGCGTSQILLNLYTEFNCKTIYGIEGSLDAFNYISDTIKPFIHHDDVTNENIVKKSKYDVVICTECAEHIPTELSQKLINNLCNCGSTIIFSAAAPNQRGAGHINCQLKEYWIKLFSNQGYIVDIEKTKQFVEILKDHNVQKFYITNMIIFKGGYKN